MIYEAWDFRRLHRPCRCWFIGYPRFYSDKVAKHIGWFVAIYALGRVMWHMCNVANRSFAVCGGIGRSRARFAVFTRMVVEAGICP